MFMYLRHFQSRNDSVRRDDSVNSESIHVLQCVSAAGILSLPSLVAIRHRCSPALPVWLPFGGCHVSLSIA
jgi:hypothetical protein